MNQINKTIILLTIGIMSIANSCKNGNRRYQFVKPHYYFDDGNTQMELLFKQRKDTTYISYACALDRGKYLNASYSSDSTDFAGWFTMNKLKDSSLTLKLKDYREEDTFIVNLRFRDNGRFLIWHIDSGEVEYLPKEILLKRYR